ncbi:uracil-DNA glycosylase family protein [Longibaculum muris]|uniref:hypothetical protein n=1 Tax=Longibaculum muris TaxID=1796628 RepID=UPI0022DEFB58|nr:hypothetical protein [Longibaculum muris]
MTLLPNYVDDSWKELLSDDFIEKLNVIEKTLDRMPLHDCGYAYFPKKDKIMRFLSLDLQNIKCIILGMEPYPSWYTNEDGKIEGVATGRSFEVKNVKSWQQKFKQASLINILKAIVFNETGQKKTIAEIRNDIDNGDFQMSEPPEWFDKREQSGVLFLNATLTVEPDQPDSHTQLWKEVMNDVMKYIDKKNKNVKWLLFGKNAKQRVIFTIGENDNQYHCCHPRLPQFVDENIFKNIEEIKWNL